MHLVRCIRVRLWMRVCSHDIDIYVRTCIRMYVSVHVVVSDLLFELYEVLSWEVRDWWISAQGL